MSGTRDVVPADDPFTEEDVRPQVMLPSSGIPTWVIAVMAATVGLVVLLMLNAQPRLRMATAADRSYPGRSVPALPRSLDRDPGSALGLADATAAPPPSPSWITPAGGAPFSRPPAYDDRPRSYAADFGTPSMAGAGRSSSEAPQSRMVFPTAPMPGAPQPGGGLIGGGGGGSVGTGGSAVVYDTGRGANGAGGAGDGGAIGGEGSAARASLIRNQSAIVTQGEVLAATLETPVNSLRPGPIRAVIARDVRSFNGTRVLIPRGSRLIGEYRADPAPGRRRVLATWTRLIRPDGVAIRIDSPAADAMGATGLPGKVDTHFLARFLNATLQSALQVGVNLASRPGNSSVIVTNAPQLSQAMGPTIIPGADDPPTVSVRPGAAISVFVARDLDFAGVPLVK